MSKRRAGAVCSLAAVIGLLLAHGHIRTNEEGLNLIGNAEGCRLDPYICPAGFPTDGVGNTHNVRAGKTLEQIADDWRGNILDAEACVNRYGNGANIPDNAFSAAVSLTFRVGCGKVRNSTLFTLLKEGPEALPSACNQFPRWKYGGGKLLPGLVTRSLAEKNLCLKDVKK